MFYVTRVPTCFSDTSKSLNLTSFVYLISVLTEIKIWGDKLVLLRRWLHSTLTDTYSAQLQLRVVLVPVSKNNFCICEHVLLQYFLLIILKHHSWNKCEISWHPQLGFLICYTQLIISSVSCGTVFLDWVKKFYHLLVSLMKTAKKCMYLHQFQMTGAHNLGHI